jgi:hypothetical protein
MSFVVLGFVPQMSHNFDWSAANGMGFIMAVLAKILTSGIFAVVGQVSCENGCAAELVGMAPEKMEQRQAMNVIFCEEMSDDGGSIVRSVMVGKADGDEGGARKKRNGSVIPHVSRFRGLL